MEVDKRQHLRDDQTSNCRSYGSINHPVSQSRKMSIGVVVDSLAKKKYGCTKEKAFLVPNAEKVKPNLGNALQGKSNGEEVTTAKITKESENAEHVSSPWMTTRPFDQKIPILDTAPHAKQASNMSSGRKREGVQNFKFATVQEVTVLDKEVLVEKTYAKQNTKTESLKMKLWNILGAAASPNVQPTQSQEHEVDGDNLNPQPESGHIGGMVKTRKKSDKPEDTNDEKGDAFINSRENSDTIETDSEGSDDIVRRPVTRSLIRKRARAKVEHRTAKCGPSSVYKQKQQDNVFFFEHECYEIHEPAGRRSSKSMPKKRENTASRTETHKVGLPEKDNSTKVAQAFNKSQKQPPLKKPCFRCTKMGDFHGALPVTEREFGELEKNIQEKKLYHLLLRSRKSGGDSVKPESKDKQQDNDNPSLKSAINPEDDFLSPTVGFKKLYQLPLRSKKSGEDSDKPESKDKQQDYEKPTLKNAINPEEDVLTPTFGFRPPAFSSSPSSILKSDQMADCSSPAQSERCFEVGNMCSLRIFSTSKQDASDDAQTQSSDSAEEIEDSPLRKTSPVMEKVDAESGLSLSLSEGKKLRMSEEGSPIIQGDEWTIKDHCIKEPSEPNEVDGVARAVKLFSLGLQKLKTKMKRAATRKSSEILKSVAVEVHLQLQNVESQIQTDMGKLTNLSKSKRRKVKTKFEEQQEQLKVICDKFKEQINQHLQDCRSTFEGLEVYQTEFKGAVEKQKASHRKLVLQVEEAIEAQLNDAQKRIKVLNETSGGQMLQLKQQLALLLKEGILS